MIRWFAFNRDSSSDDVCPERLLPTHWPARPVFALLLALLALLVLRPGPAAALYVAPTGPTEIVSAGFYHTCALTPAGNVECWGWNGLGQAGSHAGPFTRVSAGGSHTCALTPAGVVWCWGSNDYGQVGGDNAAHNNGSHPGPYTQVSAGGFHTCALTPGGAVECWGYNSNGQADNHAGPYTQVSAGLTHTCALKTDGKVECWGDAAYQSGKYDGLSSQVSAGSFHTCALTPDGAVRCWGYNGSGQVGGDNDTHDNGIHAGPYTQVSAGDEHTCARKTNGVVECWGANAYGQAGSHAGPYTQVSAGEQHTCALTPAGVVECWANNYLAGTHDGPFGPYRPPMLPEIVSAGGFHTCALTPAGAVECWGSNGNGQAGTHAGPYSQVSAGGTHTCALTTGGAVECWGLNDYGQVGGANGTHAGPYSQVSAGGFHTCALTPAGAVECWGYNIYGQAGNHAGPYTQVSAGDYHTCALTLGGAVECWGLTGNGQAENHAGPYSQVSAGFWHTCALTPAGAVECWGYNGDGQAGTHAGPYSQVSASGFHSCALTPDGAVECWGMNDYGQAGSHAGSYSQVTGGGFHTCALTPGGAVECWGDNGGGQVGDDNGVHTGPYGPYVPETTITAAPPPFTNSNDPSFEFSSDVFTATFECRLDAGAWGVCSSPKSYTDLADGQHTFEVRAVSPPANPDATPAAHTWTIDTIAPTTTITAAPSNRADNPDATFAFTGDDGNGSGVASYECRLDGGAWAACVSPQSYTGLADGEHTFEVRATDNAGNTGPAANHTWTIDTAVPVYLSTTAAGSVGSLSFGPDDILLWDGHSWSKWFDGSAAQLTPNGRAKHNISALWIPDTAGNDVVMAFAQNARFVPGVSGKVSGMDLVWWDGSAFSLWFDGQDVGLNVLTTEKIDALHVLPGNLSPIGNSCQYYLLISTAGNGQVPNYSGGNLRFNGADVLGFCMTNSGTNTAGLWHRVLDGRAEGMPAQSLVNLSASGDGQVLYLTTRATFHVDSATGGHSMVYRYDFATKEFSGPFFSAPANGLNRAVNGLQVDGELP